MIRPIHFDRCLGIAIAIVLALCCAAPAGADEEPSAEARAEARELVEKGRALQKQGRYEEAIDEYRAAYRLIPHPQLLFNIGQAYRLMGDEQQALSYYEQYLEREPEGSSAETARRFADEISESLDDTGDEAEIDDDEREPVKKRKRKRRSRADDDRASRFSMPVLASLGVGVVGVGLGVAFGIQASDIASELDGTDWDPSMQGRYDEGKSAERNMYIAYGVGGAALLLGAVLYFRSGDDDSDAEQAVIFAPSLGDSHAGIWMRGRF